MQDGMMQDGFNGYEDYPLEQTAINDGCIELGINVYDYYAIASVRVSNRWRMYPSDDNIMQLKRLLPAENLHWHYG